ncbi:ComEC/Rec2 family competence protein [Candidatus Gottesmanbacteria bacterium]|nr:ComEC/Rec2 family competence protein [Candidatus Gottesmanbacteria bacterium]
MTNPFIPLINFYLPEPEASLLTGMLFGVTENFSPEFKEALITTGTIHVVALSGTNISLITNLIAKFTFFAGRRLSVIISIISVISYVIFVGPSPTIVRAGIMGGISLLGLYFGRQVFALWSLVFTAIVMVLFDFSILTNVSFQLSFFSTLGILVFAPSPVTRVIKKDIDFITSILIDIKSIFWENLRTTLAAQIGTLPIILFTFKRVSTIAPLTNVLVGWTVPLATISGMIAVLLGSIFPDLGWVVSWISYAFLYLFVTIVDLTSRIPFANIAITI